MGMALHLVLGGDFWNQCVNCTCAGPDDSPSEITLLNFQRLASLCSSFASSTHPFISSLSNRVDRLLTRKLDSGKMVTACLLSQDPEIKDCVPYFHTSHASWNIEDIQRKYSMVK